MKKIICFFAVISLALSFNPVNAQGIEEWGSTEPDYHDVNSSHADTAEILEAPDVSDALFIGTSSNNNTPSGTLNDVFAVDTNNSFESILSGNSVWGATADPVNQRILFTQSSGITPPQDSTGGGDNLFELAYSGGTPQFLGRITFADLGLRIDGLALRNGVLYGYNAGNRATNGFYQIDLTTFVATFIANPSDSIGGLDADPKTCVIYGTNDTTGQVIRIDTSGNVTELAAYPVGIIDIDGIAVGDGYAYLITDEAQDISVLNLSTLQYESSLTSPFGAVEDKFAAGALAIADPASDTGAIFDNGFDFDYCADTQ